MARKYELITELYQRTVAGLAAPQEWQRFLTTACHNFRLPFDEQVLFFAQRRTQPLSCPSRAKTAGTSGSGVGSTVGQPGLPSLTIPSRDDPGSNTTLIYRIPTKAALRGLCRSGPCARSLNPL